jgi:hypothetical protein
MVSASYYVAVLIGIIRKSDILSIVVNFRVRRKMKLWKIEWSRWAVKNGEPGSAWAL